MRDRASKGKGLLWVLGALALGVLLAVGLTPLAHAIPWSWEQRLGRAVDLDLAVKACRPGPEAEALLQKVLARLYPLDPAEAARPLELRVVKDPAVNAYAGLGGRLTLNGGLLSKAESAEELAGVLAHEIEHVRHRHVMEGAIVHLVSWEGIKLVFGGGSVSGGLIRALLRMDFTRAQEAEADEAALGRLQRVQVDTGGLKRFFERLQQEQLGSHFLSDHPDNAARIKMAEAHPTSEPRPILTPAQWKVLQAYGCSP